MTTTSASPRRLIDPPDPPGWRTRAACRGMDPELFFPNTTGPKRADGRDHPDVERAKAVCTSCKVRDACREFALAEPGIFGVWGGMWQDELQHERRLRMRRKRTGGER